MVDTLGEYWAASILGTSKEGGCKKKPLKQVQDPRPARAGFERGAGKLQRWLEGKAYSKSAQACARRCQTKLGQNGSVF